MQMEGHCPNCNESTAPSTGGCDCQKVLEQEMAEWEAMSLIDWRKFLDDLEAEG